MEKTKITKQIIVLLMDKNNPMSMGKAAAQASHASMAILLDLIRSQTTDGVIGTVNGDQFDVTFSYKTAALHDWLNGHFRKIVCYVHTEAELLDVYNKAKSADLLCCLITDAGFTHFDKPSITAVGIGPAYSEDVDPITRKLRLLNTPVEDEIIKE